MTAGLIILYCFGAFALTACILAIGYIEVDYRKSRKHIYNPPLFPDDLLPKCDYDCSPDERGNQLYITGIDPYEIKNK